MPTKVKTAALKVVGFGKHREKRMYEISGFDTSGSVKLKRMSFPAALKKARELLEDGCWDVQILDPDGRVYTSFEEQAA
jgi:hypothetical protein